MELIRPAGVYRRSLGNCKPKRRKQAPSVVRTKHDGVPRITGCTRQVQNPFGSPTHIPWGRPQVAKTVGNIHQQETDGYRGHTPLE